LNDELIRVKSEPENKINYLNISNYSFDLL